MEPLKPFEVRLTATYWALPLAVSYWRGRFSVTFLCVNFEFGRT